jgi:uncharacterized protein YyaL (SSP411 family)
MMTISTKILVVVSSILLFSSPVLADEKDKSDIVTEPIISPYLKFHRNDLVKWQSWNTATLQLARSSGKPILLSSGYYACHYCHVMKRESFENPAIADFINEHFIPVLIDRELQPVLDAQLLRFMEVIGAPQGWPLNVVLTANGYPLVGTVYRPASAFLEFLQQVQIKWSQDPAHWERIAQAVSQQIVAEATVPAFVIETPQQQKRIHDAFEQQARLVVDREYGGFGNGAKYPMSPQLLALIRLYAVQPTAWLETHLRKTLHNMASSGLHDPLGGGFFRYTTDRQWRMPHYEKMLYDNAQLALVYLEAARILNDSAFQHIAIMTMEFLLQSMSATSAGFVASLSAVDILGNDGGYYLWTVRELKSILTPQEFRLITRLWEVIEPEAEQGTQRYLPTASTPTETELTILSKALGMPQQQTRKTLKSAWQKLIEAREKRQLLRDEKRLAGWNGLTLLTFARAARLLGESHHRQTADQLYQFIAGKLWNGDQLRRTPEGGISELADYAYIAAGLMEYAQLTDAAVDYRLCARLVEQAWQRFYIDGFWRRSENLELLLPYTVYPVTLPDNELPSPSATLIEVTLKLGNYLEKSYTEHAHKAQRTADGNLTKSPFFYGTQITGWQTVHANNELH